MGESPILKRIKLRIDERQKSSRFRTVAPLTDPALIDCASNSYLSLHKNTDVAIEAKRLTNDFLSGNIASRLIQTNSPLYNELEAEIAEWKQTESALVFNSGYTANVGIISALASRNTDVFCDRLNHASIIDGIKLSGAKMIRYAHCNVDHLRTLLAASDKKEKLIITDSVFSMDGDVAPLAQICELAGEFDTMVMVDEAHAAGDMGAHLCGAVEALGVHDKVDIVMGTLSKSVAGLGGYFAGTAMIRDYFVNEARSMVFSTALPHSVLAHDLAALRYIRAHTAMGKELLDKADVLRNGISSLGFDTRNSTTQIVPCVIGTDADACALSAFLASRGIKAPAIRPPTVPQGTARIRFSVQYNLSIEDISLIINTLAEWKKSHE
jgi:8-amino-7-oxononanoate synthase